MSQNISQLIQAWGDMGLISWAGHKYGWITESGQPIQFATWQNVVLSEYLQHRDIVSTLFISSVKKAGKTLLNSVIITYRWLTIPSVHFVVGNDKDQSAELQFNMISAMIKRHPILKRYTKLTKDTILFEPTGSRVVSLPMDASGAAGANFATVNFSGSVPEQRG